MVVFFHVERVVAVKVLRAAAAVDSVDEAAREGGLIEERVVWTQEVVAIAYGAVMVDLSR